MRSLLAIIFLLFGALGSAWAQDGAQQAPKEDKPAIPMFTAIAAAAFAAAVIYAVSFPARKSEQE